MIIDTKVLELEATVSDWITGAPGWWGYIDRRPKRSPHRPTFLALNTGAGLTVAVYARPRRLSPRELPDLSPLPPGWLAAVWHPRLAGDVRRWLRLPLALPLPGALDRSAPGGPAPESTTDTERTTPS